ncbi:MAG: BON domain-containing protein [Pirellulales bacterium]|jgi:osmotically-inducible protein OsmY
MIDQELSLCERVSRALRHDPYLARRNLRFESLEGTIKLTGVVQSYYQKQMAQEVIRRVDGVEQVENDLEVAAL